MYLIVTVPCMITVEVEYLIRVRIHFSVTRLMTERKIKREGKCNPETKTKDERRKTKDEEMQCRLDSHLIRRGRHSSFVTVPYQVQTL